MRAVQSWVLAGVVGLVSGGANAGLVTQTVPFSYDPLEGPAFPVLQGFDSEGGTRNLKAVTFEFHHQFSLDMFVESTGPTAVKADDYGIFLSYLTIFQLGTVEDENDNPPFFGPGAFFVNGYSADLAAYDGEAGTDGADSAARSFGDAYEHTQVYGETEPDVLAAVTDVGELTTVYGGFGELGLFWVNEPGWEVPESGVPEYPTDEAIWVQLRNFVHRGEIVVTYDFESVVVPEPAGLGGLVLAGLLGARRRR